MGGSIGDIVASMADVVTLNAFDFNKQGSGFGGLGSDIAGGLFGMPFDKGGSSLPDTSTSTSTKTTGGIGAVAGGGIDTFDEQSSKKKKLSTKKKGATALQIPLQSTKAPTEAAGLNTTTTSGLQL